MNTLSKLQAFMTGRKALLPGALVFSAISTITGMVPYVLIWCIAKELFSNSETYSHLLITNYAWWAVGTAVASVVFYFTALTFSHLAAFRVETNMRKQAMQKIVGLPLGFFENNTSGRIRKIIDENISITHSFLAHQLPDLAGSIVMPLTTLGLISVFEWRLGLACLIPIVVSMIIMNFMMGGSNGRKFMTSYMNSLEDMNTEAVEYVRGIPVVKVFQQTVYSFKNFHDSILKYKNMVIAYTKLMEKPMSIYTVIINSFAFILVPVAIIMMGNSGNFTSVILDLFFYILITPLFGQRIMKSMYLNQAIGQASEAVNRVEDLINVESLPVVKNPQKIKGHDICFNNVSFAYPGAKKKAIDSINLEIPDGKTIALVGASGSGKTTIARLVPRFWDTDKGKVCIGGVDVRQIDPDDLMQHISFVFQNNKLFKTTLRENILYGNPTASNQDVERALELAQCREIINRLPNGLNTKIGVDGTYLSGGEQQRISLARAILKNAPIVVLDEATAFTDPENEHLIQQGLEELTEGKTVLMIAHRLTSVQNADKILVIDKGKIVEQGSHQNLISENGIYSKMWNEYQQSIKWTIKKEEQHA
ncbi:ABC transporter ATP-binding protein [Marinilabiliaceae bacterium JC017]|nr:ABC transporter ATP-binding protein [Marinilabiliaceae bacterium JC017]